MSESITYPHVIAVESWRQRLTLSDGTVMSHIELADFVDRDDGRSYAVSLSPASGDVVCRDRTADEGDVLVLCAVDLANFTDDEPFSPRRLLAMYFAGLDALGLPDPTSATQEEMQTARDRLSVKQLQVDAELRAQTLGNGDADFAR